MHSDYKMTILCCLCYRPRDLKFYTLTRSIERKDGILLRHEVGLRQLSNNLASDNIYRQLLYFQARMDVLYHQ